MVQTGSVSCFARNSYVTDRKETPDESMIRTVKDPGYDVKTGLYRITC